MDFIKFYYYWTLHRIFYSISEYTESKWRKYSDIAYKIQEKRGKLETIHCRIVVK